MKPTAARTLALAAALLLVPACTQEARKARHLERAEAYYAADELAKAEIEYFNIVRLDPNDGGALARLGAIAFDQGRVASSVPFLLGSERIDPTNPEVQRRLAVVHLASGRFADARAAASRVLAVKPDDAGTPLVLAAAATTPAEVAEVRATLESLIAAHPKQAALLTGLARWHLRQRQLGEAEAVARRAVALDSASPEAQATLGAVLLALDRSDEAEPCFRTASEKSPKRSNWKLEYARITALRGDTARAIELLDAIVRETPDFIPASNRLAEALLTRRETDRADTIVKRVLARAPSDADAQLLDARLRLVRGDKPGALAALETLALRYQESPQVHYQLALAQLANNETARAAANLARTTALAPDHIEAALLLATLEIRRGNARDTLGPLRELAARLPRLPQVRTVLAEAHRALQRWDDAAALYAALRAEFPRDAQYARLHGVVLAQAGRTAEARRAFLDTLALDPGSVAATEQLVALDLRAGDTAAARERAAALAQTHPDQFEAHLIRARVELAARAPAAAEPSLRRALELNPDLNAAYLLLARLLVDSGRPDEALAGLQRSLARAPNDVGALMLSGMIHQQRREHDLARGSYERLLAINPRFTAALNNVAYLYSEHYRDLDKAFVAANQARELQPSDPYALDTLGWIVFQRGDLDWAVSLLAESVSKLPDEPEVAHHLGRVHYQLGNEDAARAAFERAVATGATYPGSENTSERLRVLAVDPTRPQPDDRAIVDAALGRDPDDPVALNRLAALHELVGAFADARAALERAAAKNPRNAVVHLRLARLHAGTLRDPARALEIAAQAYKDFPDNARIQLLLGQLTLDQGDPARAASLLQDAARKLPDEFDAHHDLARALQAGGRDNLALLSLARALELEAPATALAAARRFESAVRAGAVARGTLPPDEAALLAAIAADDPAFAPATEALARDAAARGRRDEALRPLEALAHDQPSYLPARRELARQLAALPAESARATALASEVRAQINDDPDAIHALAVAAFHTGDFARTVALLRSLAGTADPGSEGWFWMGAAEHRLGKTTPATEALRRALQAGLDGEHAVEARRLLGQ